MSQKKLKQKIEEAKVVTSDYLKKVQGGTYKTDMEVSIMSPFGPSMMKAKLPDEILEHMLSVTDIVTDDKDKVNWGHALAGQVEDEPVITNELWLDTIVKNT